MFCILESRVCACHFLGFHHPVWVLIVCLLLAINYLSPARLWYAPVHGTMLCEVYD